MRPAAKLVAAVMLGLPWWAGAQAQEVVKIGQIEAQTGPNTIYGWMSSQGVPIAIDEINRAGGFRVGDKTYKLQLMSLDTRGDPKEATIDLKRLLEQEKVKYVFGPFLSNVFLTVEPYARLHEGKFLLLAGATRVHDFVGKPGHDFVIRTWNWDAGPTGFGERMVDYLIETAHPRKVAMLFQNDQGGRVLGEIYEPVFKSRGIETVTEYFEPGTKDFTPALAKLAGFKPDYLFPGYTDAPLYDIVRQATEGNYMHRFFLVRGSLGPGLKNKDGIDDYIVYAPKYFEEAEKTSLKVKAFVDTYKTFYKREFPYDQAPLCSSSCYDHVYMLVAAMQKAGTVDDVAKVREALLSSTYTGLWTFKFDATGEEVFDFDIVHMHKGGSIQVTHVVP